MRVTNEIQISHVVRQHLVRTISVRARNERGSERARMVNQSDARLVVVSSFSFAPSNPEAPETHTSAFSKG